MLWQFNCRVVHYIQFVYQQYDKYKLQDELSYKSTFQVGNIADKDLSNEKYNIYNTAIVIGLSYKKVDMSDKSKVYLSSCSIGEDYHIVLKNKLEVIKEYLENKGYIGKIFVDNNPLDERLLAYNAGLGFFGKNNFKKIISKIIWNCKYELSMGYV